MSFGQINYLPVVVAGLAFWLLGAIWYSPVLFGNAWMKALGKSKEQLAADTTPLNYVWALITSLLAAYAIARILVWSGGTDLYDSMIVGLLAGVCFAFSTILVNDRFEGRPWSLTIINGLYRVCGFTLAGAIIGMW